MSNETGADAYWTAYWSARFESERNSLVVAQAERIKALEEDADRLYAQLRAVEWEGIAYEYGDMVAGCVSCGNPRTNGHAPDCGLRAALTQHEVTRGAGGENDG